MLVDYQYGVELQWLWSYPLNRLSATLCSLFIQAAGLYFSTWHSPSKTEWLSSDHFGMPLWPHELTVDAEEGAVLLALNLLTSLYVELPGPHWSPSYITLSALLFTYIYFAVQGGWEKIVMRWICNDELLSATEERDLGIETKGGRRERNWFVGEWRLLSSTLHNSADLFHLRNRSSQRSWQILVRLKYSPSMSSFPPVS